MKRLIALLALIPLGLLAQILGPQNVLTWEDKSTIETGFSIERKSVACGAVGTFAEIATVGANVTTYTDNAVSFGSSYCYRVAAFNADNKSAYSNEAGRRVPFPAFLPSEAPSGLGVK